MKTKHTKGEWITVFENIYSSGELYSIDKSGNREYLGQTSGNAHNNAKLIATSPKAFIIIIESYIRMQIESNNNVLFAITTDSMRASYVGYLANVLSIKSEQVQTEIEGLAVLVGNNEISVDEAIKKATE